MGRYEWVLWRYYDVYIRDLRICGVTLRILEPIHWRHQRPTVLCQLCRWENWGTEQYGNLLRPVHVRVESPNGQLLESLLSTAPPFCKTYTWDGPRSMHVCCCFQFKSRTRKGITHRCICVRARTHAYINAHVTHRHICKCAYICVHIHVTHRYICLCAHMCTSAHVT